MVQGGVKFSFLVLVLFISNCGYKPVYNSTTPISHLNSSHLNFNLKIEDKSGFVLFNECLNERLSLLISNENFSQRYRLIFIKVSESSGSSQYPLIYNYENNLFMDIHYKLEIEGEIVFLKDNIQYGPYFFRINSNNINSTVPQQRYSLFLNAQLELCDKLLNFILRTIYQD